MIASITAVSTNRDVVSAAKAPEQQRNKIAMKIEIFLFLEIKVLVQRYLHKYTKVKKCKTSKSCNALFNFLKHLSKDFNAHSLKTKPSESHQHFFLLFCKLLLFPLNTKFLGRWAAVKPVHNRKKFSFLA